MSLGAQIWAQHVFLDVSAYSDEENKKSIFFEILTRKMKIFMHLHAFSLKFSFFKQKSHKKSIFYFLRQNKLRHPETRAVPKFELSNSFCWILQLVFRFF